MLYSCFSAPLEDVGFTNLWTVCETSEHLVASPILVFPIFSAPVPQDPDPPHPPRDLMDEEAKVLEERKDYDVALLAYGPRGPTPDDADRPLAIRYPKGTM